MSDHIWEATKGWGIGVEDLSEGMRPGLEPPIGMADDDFGILFEDADQAQAMYDFLTGAETGVELVKPGEVILTISEQWGQYSLSFLPSIVYTRPELLRAIVETYYEFMASPAVDEALEGIDEAIGDLVERKKGGNPFHGVDGKFAEPEELMLNKKGSLSIGKRKNKLSGKSKKRPKWVATKLPCGRAAREVGKNVRCYDGKKLPWTLRSVGRLMRKVRGKKKNESIWTAHDKYMLEHIAKVFAGRSE